MNQPLVSVIVPHYKHPQFIERCLTSISDQTYKDIELIVIDDCSPDGSGKVVEELCSSDALRERFSGRLKFVGFSKNAGAHSCINHGIDISLGEYISIINSDDMYHPNRIERILKAIERHESDIVFTKVRYIDANDADVTDSHEIAMLFRSMQERIEEYASVGFSCLPSNAAISTGNFVFSKELYSKVGDFREYRYCHDWDFLLRALVFTEPYFLEEDLYYYRFHGKNSFESLQGVADKESTSVLSHYFSLILTRKTQNEIAPSPYNWPGYFELFLELKSLLSRYKLAGQT